MNIKKNQFALGFWFGALLALFIILATNCANNGSEIGNPVNPGDTTLSPEEQKYISVDESAFLQLLGDSLTPETLYRYNGSPMFDSMLVKAFNAYYYR